MPTHFVDGALGTTASRGISLELSHTAYQVISEPPKRLNPLPAKMHFQNRIPQATMNSKPQDGLPDTTSVAQPFPAFAATCRANPSSRTQPIGVW